MRKRDEFEDDGRTIADMSGIVPQRTFLPRHWDTVHRPAVTPSPEPEQEEPVSRPWEPSRDEMSSEDRKVYIFAALRAGLLIGGIYILAAVLLIVAMLALWT